METVIINWNDGSPALEAEVNGGSFIVEEKPEFPTDLSVVTLDYSNGTEATLNNARIIECASTDGRYWFTIQEIPQDIIDKAETQAKIDYLAMMTDVDLEEAI